MSAIDPKRKSNDLGVMVAADYLTPATHHMTYDRFGMWAKHLQNGSGFVNPLRKSSNLKALSERGLRLDVP